MFYPNNIKKEYKKEISYSNRGMDLEYLIEQANIYYRDNDIAYIYKKPTPIHVVKKNNNKIVDAYYEAPSTLDFNGLFRGKYIEFDAKKTCNKTSFPISNVHEHQIRHMRNINNHGGIVFLIINMNGEYYILKGSDFLSFIDNYKRKSIPYDYLKNMGIKVNLTLKGLDYLSKIKEIYYEEIKN